MQLKTAERSAKSTSRMFGFFAGSICCLALAGCGDYEQMLRDTILKALNAAPYKDYKWITYPTDDYGLGTSYFLPLSERELYLEDQNYLCGIWSCFDLDSRSARTDS